MRVKSLGINNFRRLSDVVIDLEEETTVFVGANNSGKTSATNILKLFVGNRAREVSVHDFGSGSWTQFEDACKTGDECIQFPTIKLDLWLHVEKDELFQVVDLLPSLAWDQQPVGIRIEFAPVDEDGLRQDFASAVAEATALKKDVDDFEPWPQNMFQYLEKRLSSHYAFRYFVLDPEGFNEAWAETDPDRARLMSNSQGAARAVVDSLITIDFLDAQRFLTDSEANARTGDLSRSLSKFYARNLEKFEADPSVLQALDKSEREFNAHLEKVFSSTLKDLNELGYPGLDNPDLVIRSSFSGREIMAHDTEVQYALPGNHDGLESSRLPEKYNGLGFKNLIYMVIQILDFHQKWIGQKEGRTPLHLVVIEEPEAHLHAQLQQVFIAKVQDLVEEDDKSTQLVITTHSAHIINESRFVPIRYFQRVGAAMGNHETVVRDISRLNAQTDSIRFLERYMKLTHCDLFFADGAILVEGNVERLLMSTMIEKSAPSLGSNYLTVLEVGGAFAHKFEPLLELLGLPTLVVTDLDCVSPDDRKACRSDVSDARTSNPILRYWHPKEESIRSLLELDVGARDFELGNTPPSAVGIAFQSEVEVQWEDELIQIAGRTFEEALAFENLKWVMDPAQKELGLNPMDDGDDPVTVRDLAESIHQRVRKSSFKKTDFALALMVANEGWVVPEYIRSGLEWLSTKVNDLEESPETPDRDGER